MLGERPEHHGEVGLLERLAAEKAPFYLPDQQQHRRRILKGGVNADSGIASARAAGDQANAGFSRQLAVRLGHHRGAVLMPAGDHVEPAGDIVKRIENRQIALAWNAKHPLCAMRQQRVDHQLPAGAELPSALLIRHARLRPPLMDQPLSKQEPRRDSTGREPGLCRR